MQVKLLLCDALELHLGTQSLTGRRGQFRASSQHWPGHNQDLASHVVCQAMRTDTCQRVCSDLNDISQCNRRKLVLLVDRNWELTLALRLLGVEQEIFSVEPRTDDVVCRRKSSELAARSR